MKMTELFTEQQNKIFNTLYKLDVNENVEKKKQEIPTLAIFHGLGLGQK